MALSIAGFLRGRDAEVDGRRDVLLVGLIEVGGAHLPLGACDGVVQLVIAVGDLGRRDLHRRGVTRCDVDEIVERHLEMHVAFLGLDGLGRPARAAANFLLAMRILVRDDAEFFN